MIIKVNEWLYLVHCTIEEAKSIVEIEGIDQLVSVALPPTEPVFSLCSLNQLYDLAKFIDNTKERYSGSKLAFCSGADPEAVTACAFLLGSYMIVHYNVAIDKLSTRVSVWPVQRGPRPHADNISGRGLDGP